MKNWPIPLDEYPHEQAKREQSKNFQFTNLLMLAATLLKDIRNLGVGIVLKNYAAAPI
jgi:hypothetical protein